MHVYVHVGHSPTPTPGYKASRPAGPDERPVVEAGRADALIPSPGL